MKSAYCGSDCRECPVYLASVGRDTAAQIRLADEYSTVACRFSKEDMYCLGCHSDTVSQKMCGECEIRICGAKKSYGSCAECSEFPCSILEKYSDDAPDILNRLKQLAAEYRKAE